MSGFPQNAPSLPVNIERGGRGSYQEISVGTTAAVALGANSKRRSFTISNNTANPLFLSFGTKASGNSIFIGGHTAPVYFDSFRYGDLITQDVWLIFSGGSGTVPVTTMEY